MVLEEHGLSVNHYSIPTNNPLLVIHNTILHQPPHNILNNCLRHIDQNTPQKVSNMDSEIPAIHSTHIAVNRRDEKPSHNIYHNNSCHWVLVAGESVWY